VNAIKAAASDTTINKPRVISISYGNPEDDDTKSAPTGQAIKLVNGGLRTDSCAGSTICCSIRRRRISRQARTPHVDFPRRARGGSVAAALGWKRTRDQQPSSI